MRSRFKVLSVENDIHTNTKTGEKYSWGKATDGTKFEGMPITFEFSFNPDEPIEVFDIISGEFADPSCPTMIQAVFLEQRYLEPTSEEPEIFPLPVAQERQTINTEPLEDVLTSALSHPGDFTSHEIRTLAARLLILEREVIKLSQSSCKCKS
jgi:hypothetical protein